MSAPTKYLIYCRVSGKKQASEGAGLDSQEYRCRQYAEAKGYAVEAVFPDIKTAGGEFLNRPGMVALLAYMDAHPDVRFVVIFDDLKRYSRETEDYLKLRRAMSDRGAMLECLNFNFEDTPEGKFVETISVAAGTLEREQMARQNRQKAQARIEQGYSIRSVPPVGFKYVPAKGGGKVLVHDEPIASIIRYALVRFANGTFQTQSEIVRYLESEPAFPKDRPDGTIIQQTVKRMLEQIMYGGYVAMPSWGVSMREAKHEGIVDKETFWRIQERLKQRPVKPARIDTREDFPLRGAVTCSSCGYSLTGGWSKGKRKHYAYYFCHHHGCSQKGKTIPVVKLEGRFEEVLQAVQPTPPYFEMIRAMFARAWEAQAQRVEASAKIYAEKAHEIETDIGRAVNKLIEVSNPRALKTLEGHIEALEKQKLIALQKASRKAKPTRPFEDMFEHALRFLSNPYDCWKIGSAEARALVLRLVFSEPLSYTRETGCLNTKKASVFSLLEGDFGSNLKMVPPE